MANAAEAAWAAWDPKQARPEEEQAPNLLEAARLKQSVAQCGRAGSSHSGSHTGNGARSSTSTHEARSPAGSTAVMQGITRPLSSASTTTKRSTASHPMSSKRIDLPASSKTHARQTSTNGQTRLASPPTSCNPALEASMADSQPTSGWEIPTERPDTASGWETAPPIQQTAARPARDTATTAFTPTVQTSMSNDIRAITLPISFPKTDESTASLSGFVCRLENVSQYADRVNLKVKTPTSGDWYVAMQGPATDLQKIEKEVREWLDQQYPSRGSKQENAADLLRGFQDSPSATSPSPSTQPQNHHLPPFSPSTSAHRASSYIPNTERPHTPYEERAVNMPQATEPSLIPPQANVKVARSARPLPDQVVPTASNTAPHDIYPHESAQTFLHKPDHSNHPSPPSQPKPQRHFVGYLSIPISPLLTARFGPLIKDFARLFDLKKLYIENHFLRFFTHSGSNDRNLEVARRTLAILGRCSFPNYATECQDFQLTQADVHILNKIRGPHIAKSIPDSWIFNIARRIKEEVEILLPIGGDKAQHGSAALGPSEVFEDTSQQEVTGRQSLSVMVPYSIMRRLLYSRPHDKQPQELFGILSLDSVSYDSSRELLVFSDESADKIEFARKVIAVLLRITEWDRQPTAKNMSLGPIERSVKDGIMVQKDRIRGIHTVPRLNMLVRKMKEACESGGWQEEELDLYNDETREVQNGFKDSGSWPHASEQEQDIEDSEKLNARVSNAIPQALHIHQPETQDHEIDQSPSTGNGWLATDGKENCAQPPEDKDAAHRDAEPSVKPEAPAPAQEHAPSVRDHDQGAEAAENSQDLSAHQPSLKRFKVTKVELAPVIALRDEVPLEGIIDKDSYLILDDSNPENIQVAYDSLRVLTLLPGNVVNGEDISPLPPYLQQILLQHAHGKAWNRRNVATKVAVVVAAVRSASAAQKTSAEESTIEASSHALVPENGIVTDFVVPQSVSGPQSVAQTDDKLHIIQDAEMASPPTSQLTYNNNSNNEAIPLTIEQMHYYPRICSSGNSIIWKLQFHPHRGRLIGKKGRNLNLIQAFSGVVAVSCTLDILPLGAKEIYILGSQNQILNNEERQNIAVALKLFNIVCRYHGIMELGVTSYHYNRLNLPNDSRLSTEEYALCEKYRKHQQHSQSHIDEGTVADWDSQLRTLLREIAELYRRRHEEGNSVSLDLEPLEYMNLPVVEPSDPEYHIRTGYLAPEEEAHEWQDLDEIWHIGREEERLRLRGSNEKALLRVADAMHSMGMRVPLSSSEEIGPSASLVGENSSISQAEPKPQELAPGWSSADKTPVNGLVETWANGLTALRSGPEGIFPSEDLLYQRSASPAAPMRELPQYQANSGLYRKSMGERPKYHVQLPGDAKYMVKIVGPEHEHLHRLSADTQTHLELVSQREARGPSHTVFVYGQPQQAEDALKHIVDHIRSMIPTWKFLSDPMVNGMIRKWAREEQHLRTSMAPPVREARPNGNSWIQEGTGQPIYIVHVPEEVLGNVRLAIRSDDFAKVQVRIVESHDLPGKLDLYGTQANCEKAVLRLREIARSHDPDWMPGGDADFIVLRQDQEENALRDASSWDQDRNKQVPLEANGRNTGWTTSQEAPRSRKESSRSVEAPVTGWSAPGWASHDTNAAQIRLPKIMNTRHSAYLRGEDRDATPTIRV